MDANGIRIVNTELLAECRNPISVLFLGNSFMEGYDDTDTLPNHVAKYFKVEQEVCLKTYNAGYTSYSPAIFVPQAKKLLPILRPDYIVVDVDETDLYDDFRSISWADCPQRTRTKCWRQGFTHWTRMQYWPHGGSQASIVSDAVCGKALVLLCAYAIGD